MQNKFLFSHLGHLNLLAFKYYYRTAVVRNMRQSRVRKSFKQNEIRIVIDVYINVHGQYSVIFVFIQNFSIFMFFSNSNICQIFIALWSLVGDICSLLPFLVTLDKKWKKNLQQANRKIKIWQDEITETLSGIILQMYAVMHVKCKWDS